MATDGVSWLLPTVCAKSTLLQDPLAPRVWWWPAVHNPAWLRTLPVFASFTFFLSFPFRVSLLCRGPALLLSPRTHTHLILGSSYERKYAEFVFLNLAYVK